MYLSLGLSLVTFGLRLVEMHEMPLEWNRFVALASRIGGVRVLVWVYAVFLAFMVLLIWLVARQHKSWARWILLVMFAVAIPRYFSWLNPSAGVLDWILIFGQFLSRAIALILIFTSNAHAWFEQSNPSQN